MPQHRVQVIWAHPRTNSLTAAVVNDIAQELRLAGAEIDLLDLYRNEFGSSLREADEPDWDNLDKQYSDEVIHHATRTKSADVVLKAGIPKVRWIGLAGESREFFTKRGYDTMIQHHLNTGIAGFCGIGDSRVELLYDTFGNGGRGPDFTLFKAS